MSRVLFSIGSSIKTLNSSFQQNLIANAFKQQLFSQATRSNQNSRILAQLRNNFIANKRTFSTSANRQAIPPIVWIFFKPITKLGAMLAGRGFRNWWAALPQVKREIFKKHLIRNKFRYMTGIGGSTTACFVFYQSHLEETPITKRKRFMLFSTEHLAEIEKLEKEQVRF
jgi:hypothetical protein